MKKIFLVFFAISAILLANNVSANNFIDRTIDGYRFRVLGIDTKSPNLIFKVGVNIDYKATSLRELMEKNNGISAVNGVFFCPADYKECRGQDFTQNERYYQGFRIGPNDNTGDRVVFAVDKDGKPFLYKTDQINAGRESQIYYGLANFPLLLWNGVSTYQAYKEKGLIDYKMNAKMQRNFICYDKTKRYIYSGYVSNIELEKLPELLLKFGCYDALNLDAGASSSLIYNGRQVLGPGRDILDGVIIERKGLDTGIIRELVKTSIEKFKDKLSSKTYEEKIRSVDKISETLDKMRTERYEKYSFNTFGPDGKKDGYEIYTDNLETLTVLYLVNYMNKELYDLKKVFASEEEARLDKIKQEQDNKNGLF